MERIALLSFHGCPYAKIGDRDTGGMNIYVLKLAEELGRLGLIVDVFTRIHDITDPLIVDISENAYFSSKMFVVFSFLQYLMMYH